MIGFGTGKRQTIDERKSMQIPAPGSYDHRSKAFESKSRFAMGIRFKDSKREDVPGSGTYEPSDLSVKKKAGSFSMGIKLKSVMS